MSIYSSYFLDLIILFTPNYVDLSIFFLLGSNSGGDVFGASRRVN